MTEEHTKRRYNSFAKAYHKKRIQGNNFYNKYVENPAMHALLKGNVNGKKVLDLGCGSGISTRYLDKQGARVTGIDISSELINIAREENPKIKFYVGSVTKTPFKSGEFDVVSSGLVAHYLKDLEPFFRESFRVVRKGGLLVLSLNHPVREVLEKIEFDGKKIKYLDRYFVRRPLRWKMDKGMDIINYHHTFEDIINQLVEKGFAVEKIIETRPSKSSRKHSKKAFNDSYNIPTFLVISARRVR